MRWQPYVPVHKRKANGLARIKRKLKKGESPQPVKIDGRKITKTFWGDSWCDHFESYSDFANRLPRGRTYARNGSILHLEISSGKIRAFVAGSDLYEINITIDKLPKRVWKQLCDRCASSVPNALDLLRGKLPEPIIEKLTDPTEGLFPTSSQIRMDCDCPDWADLCKHLAAIFYGVGNRLDESPELLFLLRGVDQNDLIGRSLAEATTSIGQSTSDGVLDTGDLEDIFGVELISAEQSPTTPVASSSKKKKRSKKKAAKKKASRRKAATKKTKPSKKKAKVVKKASIQKKNATKKKASKGNAAKKKVAKKKVVKKKSTKVTRKRVKKATRKRSF